MIRILLLSLLFLLTCENINAQTTKEDSIKIEIIKLSEEWNKALIRQDSGTLDRILSKEFVLSSASGQLLKRKEWMHNSIHELMTVSAAFVAEQKITVYTNEAISEGVLQWEVSNTQHKTRNSEFYVADIWRFNNGKWEVIRRLSKLKRKL